MSDQHSNTPEIQKPGHIATPVADIQKPGHITRAYAHAVQAQSQLVQSHEELLLAMQEPSDISTPTHVAALPGEGSRPAPPTIQEALQDVTATGQTLARAVAVLQQLLISRPLG